MKWLRSSEDKNDSFFQDRRRMVAEKYKTVGPKVISEQDQSFHPVCHKMRCARFFLFLYVL